MTKLNQLIASSKTTKTEMNRIIDSSYHESSKTQILGGHDRRYQPKDDEGERLPGEVQRVQRTHDQTMSDVRDAMTRLFDITASIDATNCVAHADVIIDGTVLLDAVPVSTLLFLEKRLTDMHTIVMKLPTLDPAEHWTYSDTAGHYQADPVETTRTKKIPRNHVKAEATERHPAQVDVYTEDVVVGTWTVTKWSGAWPAAKVRALLARIAELRDAVKHARETANSVEVVDTKIGGRIFDYLNG
jgi:hypothetical protein